MIPRSVSDCVKLLLQVTVILIVSFPTSSSNQCPQGHDPVIIRNVGIKLCQTKCNENSHCLSIQYNIETLTCRLLRAEPSKTKTNEGFVILARNHPDVPAVGCASKKCSFGQRCLESRSGKVVCVEDEKQNCPGKSRQPKVAKQEIFASSSLHDACRMGNLTQVKRILSRGLVTINNRDEKHGKTPLMVAAQAGHFGIVTFLIKRGANISQVDDDGKNILDWACKGGHKSMIKCVLPHFCSRANLRGMPPLSHAACHGRRDVVKFFVCMGYNVRQVDRWGNNALYWAIKGGQLDTVKYLVLQDAIVINSRVSLGKTPLMLAAEWSKRDIFDFLMSVGANLSCVDDLGCTILHHASFGGTVALVKYILNMSIFDINIRENKGLTPLMIAAQCGRKDVFELLLNKGSATDLVNDNSMNILHLASFRGHLKMVKYILGLDIVKCDSRDKRGRTAAMLARDINRGIYDFLIAIGCPVK